MNPSSLNNFILKTVQGTFHQGDPRLGEFTGTQCVCNALFSICLSAVKKVPYWNSSDLDYIIREGTNLYRNLGFTTQYLSVDDLPNVVVIENQVIEVLKKQNTVYLLSHNGSSELQRFFADNSSQNHGAVCILDGISFSIIHSRPYYYLFDAHSRNMYGEISESGTSVLLKFHSLIETENYLKSIYVPQEQPRYIEIQFFEFAINDQRIRSIMTAIRQQRKREQNSKYRKSPNGKKSQNECAKKYRLVEKGKAKMREASQKYHSSEIGKAKMREASQKYHSSEIGKDKMREAKCRSKKKGNENFHFERKLNDFKNNIKNGPYYICVICNRSLYKRSVNLFKDSSYIGISKELFSSRVESFDQNEYICQTCHSKLKKNKIPCQAVSNNLQMFDLPTNFERLRKLEKIIISKRILFKRITIMPKGQFPKMKGAVCNVPIDADEICNVLPRGMDNNGIVQVALKKKLNFRSNVFLEPVRPNLIRAVLQYLKIVNPLYKDIEINIQNIPEEWLNLECNEVSNNDDNDEIDFVCDSTVQSINKNSHSSMETENENEEEDENPLNEHRLPCQETSFVPNIPHELIDDANVIIAPGQDQKPVSIICDENCEELAHPHLLPTGKFGYNAERTVPLSPTKYFNQRLLNYRQKFASDTDYIFFAHAVTQHLNLNSRINIAMQKVKADGITAGMMTSDFKERVKSFIANDDAFTFMNTLKGTPAYWKRFLFEVLAMVKQLGLPTFFMTLSCADLRWNELVDIITKLQGNEITEEEINRLSYFERTNILNNNPVLLARHFQYRVEMFFKDIVVDGPLGKTKYYAIRVEFQARGSPHIHSLLWILNAPVLNQNNKEDYIAFVDNIIKCDLPSKDTNPELYDLVLTYQTHSHSKSCRKYKNKKCRYSFGKYFTDHTIVAEPLPDEMPKEEKDIILKERKQILDKVKVHINTNLDPKYNNIHHPEKPNFIELGTIEDILSNLDITKQEYEIALSISPDSGFQIHFKRSPDSCFVNNYFSEGLMAWEANIDIQPVLDYYKAVSYMCAYLSKAEDESSEAMKNAATEALDIGVSLLDQMKSIANAYRTHREMSVQEAVAIVMPEIWLRKTRPVVMFANSNIPEKRYRICRNEDEIAGMPSDSTDIFKRNMLDRYMDRPNAEFKNGRYGTVDTICYADFLSNYYVKSNAKPEDQNDCQPEILEEIISEIQGNSLPKTFPLMSSRETLTLRKERSVLRYHVPSREKQPEAFAHHLLMMFYPFRKESDLLSSNSSYSEKLLEPSVLDIVNINKQICEPYGNLVEEAMIYLRNNVENLDAHAEQENDEVIEELSTDARNTEIESEFSGQDNLGNTNSPSTMEPQISDDELHTKVRTLNKMQREIFEVVNHWARKYIKSLSCRNPDFKAEPMYIFITGSAGCGKSHLLTTICLTLKKALSYRSGSSEKEKILMLAPTGVAAINIDGTTIHSALGIPADRNNVKNIPRLSDKKRSALRNKLSDLCVIVIDEISMVSNKLLLHIHQRLVEIFGCSPEVPFAGISIIVCGDFYQLPPIQARSVFADYKDAMLNICHPWQCFKIAELTEVMRQRGDQKLIDLLNSIRIGVFDETHEQTIKSKFIAKDDPNYPVDAIHIFAENKPACEHNKKMLDIIESQEICIEAVDKVPENIPASLLHNLNNKSQMETGGLAQKLLLKLHAKVMLTSNIDVSDRLINGQIGTVQHFQFDNTGKIAKIYLKMEDQSAGLKKMRTDNFAMRENLVPLERVEKEIKFNRHSVSSPSMKRIQFPLMLSWACTVHKVQGKTFNKIVVSFKLNKQRSFHPGQIYVALSRVTSLDGLYLIGEYSKSAIKTDQRATDHYNKVREDNQIKPINDFGPIKHDSLIVTLLNTRSFNKHKEDIKSDHHLMESDVMCFTETQITLNSFAESNLSFNPFNVIQNNSIDRFSSLLVGYRESVEVTDVTNIPGAIFFRVSKRALHNTSISFLLIYRKNSFNREESTYLFHHFMGDHHVDIVLGDFNLNALSEESNYLVEYFRDYIQAVYEPTHISGSLIDHIYVHTDIYHTYDVRTLLKNVYFSDHDAIKLQLQLIKECKF